jgi:hypothetical protein
VAVTLPDSPSSRKICNCRSFTCSV